MFYSSAGYYYYMLKMSALWSQNVGILLQFDNKIKISSFTRFYYKNPNEKIKIK